MKKGQVEVLIGRDGGTYPHGNTVLVRGQQESVLIDPSLTSIDHPPLPNIDKILLTHCHEDHTPGVSLYPETPVFAHEADVEAMRSLDALMDMYGMDPATTDLFRVEIVEKYHYRERPDAQGFTDHHVFDVGDSTVTAIHTPGHTPGHTAFLIEPENVLVLGDIELTGFGPYYGDAVGSLEDFAASIERVRSIEAEWFVTFHHKGVYTDRASFLAALDAYEAVFDRRGVGNARLPQRTAHTRRDGSPPVRVPSPCGPAVGRERRDQHRPPTHRPHAGRRACGGSRTRPLPRGMME